MTIKQKCVFFFLIAGLIVLINAIVFAENGLLDLLRLKKENHTVIIENSKIGLRLFDEINIFKRLAKNDPELIEHIARTKLNMVAKNELVFVFESRDDSWILENEDFQISSKFRLLTEDEFGELLNFKISSFKFYDDLKDDVD